MRMLRAVAAGSILLALNNLSALASGESTLSNSSSSTSSDDRKCYYPDGVQSDAVACFPDQAVSACCGAGFICYSDGLCAPGPDDRRSYKYDLYRSGCTDSTWNSSSCPQVCLSSDDNLDSGQGIETCGGGTFCCGRGYDCCSNSTETFTDGSLDIVTTIPYGDSSSTSATATSSSSSTSTSSSSSSSGSSSSGSNNSVAIGIGVGVGVGGGIAGIASILFVLARHKRQTQQRQRMDSTFSSATGPGGNGGTGRAEIGGSAGPAASETVEIGHQHQAPPPGYSNLAAAGAGAVPYNQQGQQYPPPRHENQYSASAAAQSQTSPVSPTSEHSGHHGAGAGEMTPGFRLNPAEMEGVGATRYEMEELGSWKGGKGAHRHELDERGSADGVRRHELEA